MPDAGEARAKSVYNEGVASLPPWEELDHTADWALRVRGPDLRALFENAAYGMVSLIGGQAGSGPPLARRFSLSAPDAETLLVDWLTGIVSLIDQDALLPTRIRVLSLDGLALSAEVSGSPGATFSKQIKAVTYHNLAIRHTPEGFETTIVFDV